MHNLTLSNFLDSATACAVLRTLALISSTQDRAAQIDRIAAYSDLSRDDAESLLHRFKELGIADHCERTAGWYIHSHERARVLAAQAQQLTQRAYIKSRLPEYSARAQSRIAWLDGLTEMVMHARESQRANLTDSEKS